MKKLTIFHFVMPTLLLAVQGDAAIPTKYGDRPKTEDVRGVANSSSTVSGNWDLSADFLAWYASEQASAVWVDTIKVGLNTSSFGAADLAFNWDFGFRLGAGYNLEYDQWDTQLYWTWFRTDGAQTQNPSTGLLVDEVHPEFFAADLSAKIGKSAKIKWALLFNMFDWQLGRSYWVSKGLSLRPFLGLKGGWIHQPIRVQYNNLIISVPTANSGIEKVRNNFWGIGPLGGVDTKWKLHNFETHYPSLFGDFSFATLWGSWICKDTYNDTTGTTVVVNMNKLTLGALMFRGFLGMGWDVDFNKGKSHFATQLGYEMELWVNQLRLPTSQLVQLHGDLTLQGLTFNCRFDF